MTCTCKDNNISINLNSLVDDKQFKRLELLLGKIIMSQADLAAQLNAAADQAAKVNGEIMKLLEAIANQANVSPELQAAADRVSAAIQANDDLNPDA